MAGRDAVLAWLAGRIAALDAGHRLRVAIDGVDGAGKTMFADALAPSLAALGRPVVRASVDGFHQPRAARYRLGRDSPDGFYRDSYDYAALRRCLLDPFGPGGSGLHRVAAFDHRADRPVDMPWLQAPADAVLLLDGIFLHRPELRDGWGFSIFLDTPFAISCARMALRDGSPPDPDHPANRRYVEGQRRYLRACAPTARATAVIDYADADRPRVIR